MKDKTKILPQGWKFNLVLMANVFSSLWLLKGWEGLFLALCWKGIEVGAYALLFWRWVSRLSNSPYFLGERVPIKWPVPAVVEGEAPAIWNLCSHFYTGEIMINIWTKLLKLFLSYHSDEINQQEIYCSRFNLCRKHIFLSVFKQENIINGYMWGVSTTLFYSKFY